MSNYSQKFSAQNKNTSLFNGKKLFDIDSLYDKATDALDDVKDGIEDLGNKASEKLSAAGDALVDLGNDVVDGVKDAGKFALNKANEAGEALGKFGNNVKDEVVDKADDVKEFFTSTVDGKDGKLFDFNPKKKGEFYLEDYADLDYSKYEKYYDSEEIVDYLDDLTVNTSLEIYNNQQTIDFYQQFLDAVNSEGFLNTNFVRIDNYPDLYEAWLTEMDEKVHADWYADPEKYAVQIEYLESTREERMSQSCGGLPPSLVDEVVLRAAEDEYRSIINPNATDEEMKADPDYKTILSTYEEEYAGFKDSDEYAMEKYGVSGDEYYYYFVDARVNGEEIISSLSNANYNMKQGLDLEPYEQIKLSKDFNEADIDTKFNYNGDYFDFLEDYDKSYLLNSEYLEETFGVTSKEEWELYKKVNFMEESDRELYFYLLNDDEDLAAEFLSAHEDQINQSIAGVKTLEELESSGIISYSEELEQQKLEEALADNPDLDVEAFKNQCRVDTTCYDINSGSSMDVVSDYATSLGFGVRDGVIQWGEGIGNAISADGIKSVKDYQRMYMVQILSQGENSRELLDETYQFGTAAGNMLPTVVAGTAVTVATGGNAAAGSAVSKALLVTSAYGNTKEQVMQTYEVSRGQAYLYAGASAGLELAMEGKLGSVLPLADKEASSFLEAFIKEGTQEAAQSVIESSLSSVYFGEDFNVGDVASQALSEGIYGGLIGGTFYGGNAITNKVVSTYMLTNVAKNNSISYAETKDLYNQYSEDYANNKTTATFAEYVQANKGATETATVSAAVPAETITVDATADTETVADINVDNIDGETQTIETEYNSDERVKPSSENMEIFKDTTDESNFTSMKLVYDVLTDMVNSTDETVKNIGENIQNIKQGLLSKLYFWSSNYTTVGGENFRHGDAVYEGTGSEFNLGINTTLETAAHEFGHMLFDVVDSTLPTNVDSVIESTINNLEANKTTIENFFNDALDYKKQIDAKADQEAITYLDSEVGIEYVEGLVNDMIGDRSSIKSLLSELLLPTEKQEIVLKQFDDGRVDALKENLLKLTRVSEIIKSERIAELNDSQMKQIDMITGIIDSVYKGEPIFDDFLSKNRFRRHGADYFAKRADSMSFNEQFADYSAMRLYSDEYAVAWTFLKNVLGDDWFNMMEEKYTEISNQLADPNKIVQITSKVDGESVIAADRVTDVNVDNVEISDKLQMMSDFFDIDTNLKKEMIDMAPVGNDIFNVEKYVDNLNDSINYIFDEIKSAVRSVYPSQSANYIKSIEKLEKTIKNEFYKCGYDIDKVKAFYNNYVSSMDLTFLQKVKKACFGYSAFNDPLISEATTINELLHCIHSAVVNSDTLLQSIELVASKELKYDTINYRGLDVPVFKSIFDNIPEDIYVGCTDMVVVEENKMLMMVRDLGHALTMEVTINGDTARIEYFIPKICNAEMVNNLEGILNKVNQGDWGANGVIEVNVSELNSKIYDFLSKVPNDGDMPINNRFESSNNQTSNQSTEAAPASSFVPLNSNYDGNVNVNVVTHDYNPIKANFSFMDKIKNLKKSNASVLTSKAADAYSKLNKTADLDTISNVVNLIIDENAFNSFIHNRNTMTLSEKQELYDTIKDLDNILNDNDSSLKLSPAETLRLSNLYNLSLDESVDKHIDQIVSNQITIDKKMFNYLIKNNLLDSKNPDHKQFINNYIINNASNVINVTDIDTVDNIVLASNDKYDTVYEYEGERLTTDDIKNMLDVTRVELKTKILVKASEYSDPIAKARKAYIELNKVLHYDNEYLRNSYSSAAEADVMEQNKYISFGTLNHRNNVVCLGWAKLYSDLLYDLGFTKDQVILRTNDEKNHYWVELHVDENTVIIADATEGHVMSNGTYNVDLSACKADDSTTGFFIGTQQMAGHRLSTIYKNIKGEAHHYTANEVAYLKEQIDNSNNRLLQVDKEINYVNDNGLYNENIAIASARFDQLDDVSDHNESDKAMYVFNLPIPESMDGYDLFGYYKKVTSSIDSKYIKVSRDIIINENGEAEAVAELICTDDKGKVIIKAYSESNGVMMFNSYDELNWFVEERNGR